MLGQRSGRIILGNPEAGNATIIRMLQQPKGGAGYCDSLDILLQWNSAPFTAGDAIPLSIQIKGASFVIRAFLSRFEIPRPRPSSNCHDKENLDQAASEAVKDVERKLFCKLKDKGSEKEESLFDKSKDKTKDKEMLAARDWLLWQAYFSEIDGSNGETIYQKAVNEALSEAKIVDDDDQKSDIKGYMRKPFSFLPSSAGAGEIEHWVAMRREDQNKIYIKDDDLERSANYAFIATGTNQSLRDLTVAEKAVRRNSTWWPNLQFLAALTRPLEKGLSLEDRYAKKQDLLAMFDKIDCFWAKAQEKI